MGGALNLFQPGHENGVEHPLVEETVAHPLAEQHVDGAHLFEVWLE